MKKVFLTLVMTLAAVLFLDPTQTLLSKFLLLEKPVEHQIRDGDWLSKIAKEYYNDPSYWKELALVNRAPRGDRIFPGEKAIIPSFEVIREIRRARSLSEVNELIREQQSLLSSENSQMKAEDTETTAPPEEPATQAPRVKQATSSFDDQLEEVERPSKVNYALMAGVLGLVLLMAGGIYFYVSKRKAETVEAYGHRSESIENIESGRSVYLDGFEDEEQTKRGRKKREVELV